MKFLINLVAKIGGISKLWGFLDGYKTKVSGVASLLSGLAGILGQLVPLIEAKDAAAAWAFASGLPANPAWLLLVGGLGLLGVGHKLEKAVEAPKP
jgi:hypothetical protein